jgi:choloylglycine hydrolase
MDWMSDMGSNLWVFPRGMRRDGAVGPNSIQWTSRYGSVVVSVFDAATADGMNEKGLVANLLYLAETRYPTPAPNDKPGGAVYSGNASSRFRPATPFTFLAAKPS